MANRNATIYKNNPIHKKRSISHALKVFTAFVHSVRSSIVTIETSIISSRSEVLLKMAQLKLPYIVSSVLQEPLGNNTNLSLLTRIPHYVSQLSPIRLFLVVTK